jgi:hypothetical protein
VSDFRREPSGHLLAVLQAGSRVLAAAPVLKAALAFLALLELTR